MMSFPVEARFSFGVLILAVGIVVSTLTIRKHPVLISCVMLCIASITIGWIWDVPGWMEIRHRAKMRNARRLCESTAQRIAKECTSDVLFASVGQWTSPEELLGKSSSSRLHECLVHIDSEEVFILWVPHPGLEKRLGEEPNFSTRAYDLLRYDPTNGIWSDGYVFGFSRRQDKR